MVNVVIGSCRSKVVVEISFDLKDVSRSRQSTTEKGTNTMKVDEDNHDIIHHETV